MATSWRSRLDLANKTYNSWAIAFKCAVLEEYYEGRQWKFNTYFSSDPYVIKLVYSTIKIKSASLLLSYPEYKITPKPGNADYSQEIAMQSAQLKEDVLNTIVSDEKEAIGNTMQLVFLDSMFRFGVIEVGYAADWLRNPLAQRPQLNLAKNVVGELDDIDETVTIDNPKIISISEELPDNEKIYFKHVSARRFRVGKHDSQELDRCDWVGYYEFVNLNDLKVIKNIDSDLLNSSVDQSTTEANAKDYTSKGIAEEGKDPMATKVWHIWDLRSKERLLILDANCEILWKDTFKRCPIKGLRWDLRLDSWYPIPPVFQWLSPQNEYNETREMMRSHRKRFVRKFQISGDDIDEEEIDKFTNGEDGALIKVPRPDAISPIQNPKLDSTVSDALVISKADFNEVSGVSSQDRGTADRTTATEAQRLAQKADLRDQAENSIIIKLMTEIGREALYLARERFVEGTWAKITSDPGETLMSEVQENPAYKWVTTEELDDGYDFKIIAEIISTSTLRNEDEKAKFVSFLSIVNQFPQVALSPILVREAAYRSGYRNERAIKDMQRMAMLALANQHAQQVQQSQQPQLQGGSPIAQQKVAQMTPPTQPQVSQQIAQQLQ